MSAMSTRDLWVVVDRNTRYTLGEFATRDDAEAFTRTIPTVSCEIRHERDVDFYVERVRS